MERVHIVSEGRGGTIYFENAHTRFSMWWEFAGGDALALINVPGVDNWEATTKLPLHERAGVLRAIGEHVVRTQTSGRGRYVVDGEFMTVYAG
jgi:hypothetical protein